MLFVLSRGAWCGELSNYRKYATPSSEISSNKDQIISPLADPPLHKCRKPEPSAFAISRLEIFIKAWARTPTWDKLKDMRSRYRLTKLGQCGLLRWRPLCRAAIKPRTASLSRPDSFNFRRLPSCNPPKHTEYVWIHLLYVASEDSSGGVAIFMSERESDVSVQPAIDKWIVVSCTMKLLVTDKSENTNDGQVCTI